jgi:hypothetical protein
VGSTATRAPVKKPNAERGALISNDLRNRRLGDAEPDGRLCHASALHDREQGMKVAQPKLSADLALPIDPPGHMDKVISIERKMEFPL